MVGGGLLVLDPEQLGKARPKGGGELAALIWSEDGRHAEPDSPTVSKILKSDIWYSDSLKKI